MPHARAGLTAAVSVVALASLGALVSPAQAATAKVTPAVVSQPGAFVSLAPSRLLDTRDGTGAPKAPVAPHGTVTLAVDGVGSIPSSNVGAVVLNVIVTNVATSGGFLTAYPSGSTRPTASNLNFVKNQTVANLVTVTVGADGAVSIYNSSSGKVDIVADVSGYYLGGGTVAQPGMFQPLAPSRILDTRYGVGAPKKAVAAQRSINLTVAGAGSVPASGVAAVVMNVTATAATKAGYLTAYPTGTVRPTASDLNFLANQTVPNLVTVGLGSNGQVTLFNGSSGTLNLVADVAGYYLAGTATSAGAFVPVSPARILDTRTQLGTPSGALPGGTHVDVQVVNVGGIPVANVSAVAMNVTVTAEARAGYLTVSPTSPTRPVVSNLDHVAGVTIANMAIVQAGLCSKASFYNGSSGSTAVLADVAGYFLAKAPVVAGTHDQVHAWGDNELGDLGDATVNSSTAPVIMSLVHDAHAIDDGDLLVTNDGHVWGWGPEMLAPLGETQLDLDQGYGNCSVPTEIGALTAISAVAGSPSDGYALDTSGNVWSWGYNDQGQLGNGTKTDNFTPTQIPNLSNVIAITAGFALKSDGTVWGWGPDDSGSLGTAVTGTESDAPVQIAFPVSAPTFTAIAQGGAQFALGSDGSVWSWGNNSGAMLGQDIDADTRRTPRRARWSRPPVAHRRRRHRRRPLGNVTAISGGMALLADHERRTPGATTMPGQLGRRQHDQ